MGRSFKSKALEENLALTKHDPGELPEQQEWFVSLSEQYWGIHKRTEDLFLEFNHSHPNYQYIIDQLHTICLTDLWLYSSIDESEKALLFLVDFFATLMEKPLGEKLGEQLVKTLFKFIDRMVKEGKYPQEAVWRSLKLIDQGLAEHEAIYIRNAGYFKTYLAKAVMVPVFTEEICRLTKIALEKGAAFWQGTTNAEAWFKSKADLFPSDLSSKINKIGEDFFAKLTSRIKEANSWEKLESSLFYNDLANHFRYFGEEFASSVERIYYLLYLLHLPGMVQLNKHLLYDLNRALKAALTEVTCDEVSPFIDMLFSIFGELKDEQTETVLDCLFTLGKEVVQMEDDQLTAYYMQKLIEFGFIYPGAVEITDEWETKVNPNHVKNIRIWLDLIKTSPYNFRKLLSALVVNLRLGGIFISDTDLFQRDVTKLLNSDIEPVYRQVKQLARFFPVYFNEIGAEGKLREVSTAMDELEGRKDKLIHFVRKQVHTESNNMHITLVHKVAGFWSDGIIEPLANLLPRDVIMLLDTDKELFKGVHKVLLNACEHFGVDYAGFLTLPEDKVKEYINTLGGKHRKKDKQRVFYLYQLYRLLMEKYSFDTRNIIKLLKSNRFFNVAEIDNLQQLLDNSKYREALVQVYDFMAVLKEIILSKDKTEAIETIYYKRHVAIGIPSMYGQYKEPKFEALGLMYRLEQVASRLMEKLIDGVKLEYISAKTLNSIYDLLVLFRRGLELDGMVNQNFNSTLEMFRYSLTSTSVTLKQYMNIFRFLSQHISELIKEYFIRVYDETLGVVVFQVFNTSQETLARESEKFYREILTSSFLVQDLDQFIVRSLNMISNMIENYSESYIHNMMSYNPDLAISPLGMRTPAIDNQVFLGAKAYYLKKLISYDLPVPSGFVLTTEVYRHKETIFDHPYMNLELERLILKYLSYIEKKEKLKYGSKKTPMLLSVRSGTVLSMPGAMSTFLNIGMSDEIAETLGADPETAWMGWDCYRRFIQSWGMSYGIDRDIFDSIMTHCKDKYGVEQKSDFNALQMRELARAYKSTVEDYGLNIVENPVMQLKQAINNVFDSWFSERTTAYRKHLQIADEWGTAVIVQKMVMGNRSKQSGSGVVFTHNPKLKKPGVNLYGDFTLCSQGEDIVAGLVYPLPVAESQREEGYHDSQISLESAFPDIFARLKQLAVDLIEKYGFHNQEIEFTFESEYPDDLYLLQIREQNIVHKEKVPVFKSLPEQVGMLGRGIGIGGGCLSGIASFDLDDLLENKKKMPGQNHILIRPDTVPDDIQMIFMCDGLVTSRGGVTSHAAVTAEKLGIVCIVNCKELVVDEAKKVGRINEFVIKKGDELSIDGNTGNIYTGSYDIIYV